MPMEQPGLVLGGVLVIAFVVQLASGDPLHGAVSAQALSQGRFETLLTHMFAHGGVSHLLMNVSALFALSPLLISRLGLSLQGWLLYLVFFLASGLVGGLFYLAIHPTGVVPMLGASGAVSGLWGAAARIGSEAELRPLRSRHVLRVVRSFAITNAVLFALVFLLVFLARGQGGLAWEAHLGGFLFGLLSIPFFKSGQTPPS
jgi:membrane associated rhomboid family serine protease